jgi:LysR family transcriptional regulator, transcription activator of glutamate synthase operon
VPLRDAPSWTVEAVWHADRYLPVAAQTFRDFLREYIAAHPPARIEISRQQS